MTTGKLLWLEFASISNPVWFGFRGLALGLVRASVPACLHAASIRRACMPSACGRGRAADG